MRLAIIGHGYVGLVTAAIFADLGNTVYCVGRTKEKIDNLQKGIPPFYEPGLEEVVKKNIDSKRLFFTLSYKEAVLQADIVFICVGTPSKENGDADLSQVFNSAGEIADNLAGYTVVACKSTVPVGTNLKIKEHITKCFEKTNNPSDFDVASCPEFLREGTALSDTLRPDRIVIGTETNKAMEKLVELHKPINGERVLTTIPTAEMIKYVSNALLATKISFANGISFICDQIGADVEAVLDGVGLDKRLGRSFLYPGIGYGGSCFPKDVKALIAQARHVGYDFELLKDVEQINKQATSVFLNKIKKVIPHGNNKTIGVLGLSFKPDTDDMRDAPSVPIIKGLLKMGFTVKAYDPEATENAKKIIKHIDFVKSPYEAAKGASGVVVVTEWNEFKQLDLNKLKTLMKEYNIFDGRNIYEPDKVKSLGFTYVGVGR